MAQPGSQVSGFRPFWLGLRPGWLGFRPAWLGLRPGWMAQRGEWTNRLTENVPILQDFVPYQGGCPASPHENQGESRAGQGNCWPFDTFGQLFHIQILSGFKVCHHSFQRLFLKWFFFQFLLWRGAGGTAYWSFLGPVWPDSWRPPTHSPWLKKMQLCCQRRCHRGQVKQETGIEMREIGADVGGGERGQENA